MASRVIPLGLMLALVAGVRAATLDEAVGTLLAVDKEGRGHRAAMAAWNQVAAAKPAELPALFAALDKANPLSANWIRSAIEVAAERAIRNEQLPVGELESYLRDPSHHGPGRRMAFELLTQVDPKAAERLVPSMLHDPSLEMRRDAVALLIEEAKRRADAGDKTGAQKLYNEALTGALDEDQVSAIAEKLKEFGQTVDLAKHYGYVMNWKALGHFDNTDHQGFDKEYPPEKGIDLGGEFEAKLGRAQWKDALATADFGDVDLNKHVGKEPNSVTYAYSEVTVPKAQDAQLRYGTENATKVWLNGELVHVNRVYHAGAMNDQYVAPVKLKAGKNTILVKLCQNDQKESWAQGCAFNLRICDPTGTAILSMDRPERVYPDPNAPKVDPSDL